MADEGRDWALPQRARGAAGSASALSARSPLSEEVLRRMQAAVRAERGQAAHQDDQGEHAAEPEPPVEPERLVERATPITPEPAVKPTRKGVGQPPAGTGSGPVGAGRPAGAAGLAGVARTAGKTAGERAQEPARGRLSLARIVTSALVVVAAGSLAAAAMTVYAANSGRGGAGSAVPNSPALERQELAARDLAAAWVIRQVSHSAVVSCDQTMCAALTSARFPARNLRTLGTASPYPKTSAIVVETAAVRALFGSSLDTEWAPAVLATFGSGEAEITIRVIAAHGAAAYRAALGADLTERKEVGAALLQESRITVSATAAKQLAAGQVDSRLLLAIIALVTDEPIDIVRFGNIGPGGDADMPLRVAYLTESDQTVHMTRSAYVRSIVSALGDAPARQFASTETVALPDGQTVLRIEFTAPSPARPAVIPLISTIACSSEHSKITCACGVSRVCVRLRCVAGLRAPAVCRESACACGVCRGSGCGAMPVRGRRPLPVSRPLPLRSLSYQGLAGTMWRCAGCDRHGVTS